MKNQVYENHKSSIGNVNANVMALLSYLLPVVISFVPKLGMYAAWIFPLILYVLEKESTFVRFHAMQSFLLNLVGFIISIVILIVGTVVIGGGAIIGSVAGSVGGILLTGGLTIAILIVMLIFGILAMIGAYKYREYHIPIVGGLATKFSTIK